MDKYIGTTLGDCLEQLPLLYIYVYLLLSSLTSHPMMVYNNNCNNDKLTIPLSLQISVSLKADYLMSICF